MSHSFFVATCILDVSQFVKILWFMSLCYEFLIVVLSLFFSAVTSAFQLFTCKLCLQFSGLSMRNFTWNRFPIKNLLIDSLLTTIVESTYLNRDMCKFESSQKDESRWQSTDSSKAYRKTSAFKCRRQGERIPKRHAFLECLKCAEAREKLTFLLRYKREKILLPSNSRENVDFDLLIEQQNRILWDVSILFEKTR